MSQRFFDAQAVLDAIPGNHLILLPDPPRFTIVAVSDAYLWVTYTQREAILGKGVFEALTDDVDNARATGVANLSASLQAVVQHKRPHRMAHQRYDVYNAQLGRFEYKVWEPVNKPVLTASGDIRYIIHTVKDVTQRVWLQAENQQSRHKLALSESRFRETLQQAPVAMALFSGPGFVVTLANELALTYWGRQREQVLHKPLFEALPEARGQGLEALLTHVYTTGERFSAKERPLHLERQGQLEQTYLDFVYEPFRQDGQSISGVTIVCVEVTEQVLARQRLEEGQARYQALAAQLEQRVAERTQALELANQALIRSTDSLQQFTYVASHDLQEPLRKIQTFSSLLGQHFDHQLDETARGYLERMSKASGRMSRLIRDLLSYTRLATRQQRFEAVSLAAVLADVLDTHSGVIEQRKAQFSLAALPVVQGDESQLSQLFDHLLTNALKFTPADQAPWVEIQYAHRLASELPAGLHPLKPALFYHQIRVIDQGVGFEMKHVNRIFGVFQQLHGPDGFGGTGMGLAICQRVVENHGGRITASSQPGKGASFSVYLPA